MAITNNVLMEENTHHVDYDQIKQQNYDFIYNTDINTRMRVPDKLAMSETDDMGTLTEGRSLDIHQQEMTVPDRIICVGQDQHLGLKEEPKLDLLGFNPSTNFNNDHGLVTPPRVLTLEERPFPAVIDEQEQPITDKNALITSSSPILHNKSRNSKDIEADLSGLVPGDGLLISPDNIDTTSHSNETDVQLLRRHIAGLARHVRRLEQEQTRRTQREMVLYPLIIGYFIIKLTRWFIS